MEYEEIIEEVNTDTVNEDSDNVNMDNTEQEVESSVEDGRYLCHLDNPEKAQYDVSQILYYCGYNESILESPHKNEREKDEDLMYFVNLIYKAGIEDMMSLYQLVSVLCPDKVQLVFRYSNQLEKFTRGMYQQNLRKERSGGSAFTATKSTPFDQ